MQKVNVKRIILSIVFSIIIIAVATFTVVELTKQYNPLTAEENEHETIITANNADGKSNIVIYVSVVDGKQIYTEANIENNSFMEIEIYPMEITYDTYPVKKLKYTSEDNSNLITLPDGDYTLQVSSGRNCKGVLKIYNYE